MTIKCLASYHGIPGTPDKWNLIILQYPNLKCPVINIRHGDNKLATNILIKITKKELKTLKDFFQTSIKWFNNKTPDSHRRLNHYYSDNIAISIYYNTKNSKIYPQDPEKARKYYSKFKNLEIYISGSNTSFQITINPNNKLISVEDIEELRATFLRAYRKV